ncbi:MAG: hypothetical protein GF350_02595 [Chitinivibrionales bacterium]|nr:hypothetical protein [Chitinivibrionales bacterium]
MRILVLGNSLTLPRGGCRPINYNPKKDKIVVKYEQTYPKLVANEYDAELINRCQIGCKIDRVYEDFHYKIPYLLECDVIIVHTGLVDCWVRKDKNGNKYQRTPIKEFKKIYDDIISNFNEYSNRDQILIFIGIGQPHPKYKGMKNIINQYNKVLESESNNTDIYYVDLEEINDDTYKDYKYLDNHLKVKGNELIKRKISDILKGGFYD